MPTSAHHQTIHQWLTGLDDDYDPTRTIGAETVRETGEDVLRALRKRSASASPPLRIGEELASGGMAEVHRGEQTALHREVAVKALRVPENPKAVSGLIHEAWLTASLEHPNIVPIHDLSVDGDGHPVVVMRRLKGVTWAQYIGGSEEIKERFGVSQVLEWHLRVFLQVCNATGYAHSRGVIHRDIKPNNVMIGDFGEVYLLDWGIAIAKSGELATLLEGVADIALAGTAPYLAPEMLVGELDHVDEQSDVYLLGATLYDVVAGKPPHPGRTVAEILEHVRIGTITVPDTVPAELGSILHKAMHRDKRERYQSVAELRGAVERYLSHRGSDQLALHARKALVRLQETPAKGESGAIDWKTLYACFREARFGYQAAIDLWPENRRAAEELNRTFETMIGLELAHGTPEAGASILAEVPHPPAELADLVEEALAESDRRRQEVEALAAQGLNLSPRTAEGARGLAMVILGTIFAVHSYFINAVSPEGRLWLNLMIPVVLGLGTFLFRKQVLISSFNRRALGSIAVLMVVTTLIRIFGGNLGYSLVLRDQMEASVQLAGIAIAVLTLGPTTWPGILGYLGAFFLAFYSDYYYIGESFAHGAFGLYLGILWRPDLESRAQKRKEAD